MSVDTTQILDIIRLGVDKINEILLWISNFLGNWAKIEPNNIYLILLIAISLFISRKIMLLVYASGESGRNTTWLIIAGGIFALLKFL